MYRTSLLVSLLLAVACGGSTPPAEAPESSDAPAKKTAKKDSDDNAEKAADTKSDNGDAEDKDKDKDSDDKKDAKSDKDDKKDDKKDDAPKSGRTPRDILAAPDVVWVFNFNDSDIKAAAEEKCEAKSGKDPKKMNACMTAAHKVDVDGYRFVEKDGKLWWIALKISGKKIVNLHKFEADFVEKDHAAVVKPKGKDLGQAPGRTPPDMTFECPNEYQITVKDPRLGKLAYDAKIGLVSNEDAGGAAGKAKR